MNERDVDATKQLCDTEPEFRALIEILIALTFEAGKLGPISVKSPTAAALKAGRMPLQISGVSGMDASRRRALFQIACQVAAVSIELAGYFTEGSRWRMIKSFQSLALGGDGTVLQRLSGGRPPGVSQKDRDRYMSIARGYFEAASIYGWSMPDYARQLGKSAKSVQRAVNYAVNHDVNLKNWDKQSP